MQKQSRAAGKASLDDVRHFVVDHCSAVRWVRLVTASQNDLEDASHAL